jgi:DNA-binding LacI/PurR family transcriptional regulator
VAGKTNTIRDVARAARVSAATVSRVLNQNPSVKPDIRDRVLAVISSSGFRPNANARRLVQGGSGQVCFLLANRDVGDSFHSCILKGVEDYSRGQHYQVVYARFDYDAHTVLPTNDLPRILREHGGVEGVVLAGANYPSMVRYLEDLALPYVLFGNNLVNESAAYPKQNAVAFDEERGAREAVEFLLELGHRRITFIGDLSMQWYRRRFQGYRAAMLARKLRPAAVDLQERDAVELGRRAVPDLVRRYPGATAILTQDDETAVGVLESLRRIRVRVPEDISVVGYDDAREGRYLNPPLTTVRVPKERVGEMLAERLFQRIAGGAAPALMLETEMVIRESCIRVAKTGDSVLVAPWKYDEGDGRAQPQRPHRRGV